MTQDKTPKNSKQPETVEQADKEHVKQMKQLQDQQKQKRKESSELDRGLILVHTGNGKGKSSSAFGVMARALGWGHKVGVVQFIKGSWKTGEKQFFDQFPSQITWKTMGQGFTWDTQNKQQDMDAAAKALKVAEEMLTSGEFELVILDEINIALNFDYLDIEQVLAVLANRSLKTSVILTGRDAKDALMAAADLVTEMTEIKHPYQAGIMAQKGIDF